MILRTLNNKVHLVELRLPVRRNTAPYENPEFITSDVLYNSAYTRIAYVAFFFRQLKEQGPVKDPYGRVLPSSGAAAKKVFQQVYPTGILDDSD